MCGGICQSNSTTFLRPPEASVAAAAAAAAAAAEDDAELVKRIHKLSELLAEQVICFKCLASAPRFHSTSKNIWFSCLLISPDEGSHLIVSGKAIRTDP